MYNISEHFSSIKAIIEGRWESNQNRVVVTASTWQKVVQSYPKRLTKAGGNQKGVVANSSGELAVP